MKFISKFKNRFNSFEFDELPDSVQLLFTFCMLFCSTIFVGFSVTFLYWLHPLLLGMIVILTPSIYILTVFFKYSK